ncbi:hypothetical protein THAOC_37586 [Thalassiosira oceanica]|uniref:Uncharacterized protein n=1 Tax=Thalassiosira oceanica TaxID=159749 RepID=K0RBM6_THAOC|nr:hypothetical protein THAOC_37586 [Thalassiosira oceanica]|eukprot:EJK43927.1 hypothetical protein THAOC_37586 [Thalassiosira oceanica]
MLDFWPRPTSPKIECSSGTSSGWRSSRMFHRPILQTSIFGDGGVGVSGFNGLVGRPVVVASGAKRCLGAAVDASDSLLLSHRHPSDLPFVSNSVNGPRCNCLLKTPNSRQVLTSSSEEDKSGEVRSYQVRCIAYLLCFSSKTRTTTAALTNCDHFVCLEVNHQLSAKMVVQSELNSSTEQFDPTILAAVPIKVFPQGMFGNTVIDRDHLSRILAPKLISPGLNPCLPKTSPLTTISSCLSVGFYPRTHSLFLGQPVS